MKTIFRILALVALVASFAQANAQNTQELTVPLSKPGEKGTLEVNIMNGDIQVTGTTAKEVNIKITSEQKKVEESEKNGLKRIPNSSFGLSAQEDNNTVSVSTDFSNKAVKLEIQVPVNMDLKLRAINNGNISVQNVNGEIEVNHVNGGISLVDVSGSALVNTTNGDIKANFNKVTENTPMSFATFNGDVDVTLPAGTKASVKMKSEMGELFTDFDMTMKKAAPKQENKLEDGVYKVSLDEWITGDINGGGPEMTFKNFQGDIIIRKK